VREFTADEIREIIRFAQVVGHPFSDEQYRKLMELGQDLAESGRVEAAWEVKSLMEQYGIPPSQAGKKYRQLVSDVAKLQTQVSDLQRQRGEEQKVLGETQWAVQQTEEKLKQGEKELESFTTWAEKEKQRLKDEVERAQKKAGVDLEQIAAGGRLKAQLKKHGLSLDLALELLGEFARQEDAAQKLAEAVAEYGSALEVSAALHEKNEALRVETEGRQEESAQLKEECQRDREALARLRSDRGEQEALRHFWRRFHPSSDLLEYLATWPQVYMLRCYHPLCGGARFLVNGGPSNFWAKFVCPRCRVEKVDWDDDAFTALGMSTYRGPITIHLED
jgi:myosin heavy subunit